MEPGTWNLEPWNQCLPTLPVGISAPDDSVRIYNILRLERHAVSEGDNLNLDLDLPERSEGSRPRP
jgi:hypothetical protein